MAIKLPSDVVQPDVGIVFSQRQTMHVLSGLDLLSASLNRALRAEKDEEIQAHRQRLINEINVLKNKILSREL